MKCNGGHFPQQFLTRLVQAAAAIEATPNESKRIFHGRGQSVPELNYINIDWYQPLILITFYRTVGEELIEELVRELLSVFASTEIDVECIYVQSRFLQRAQGRVVWGTLADLVYAQEAGLKFILNLAQTQNIGFFPDMQPGRAWLRDRANDKKILNLFAYTCSFSVVAIDAGARSVINLDMSRGALNRGRENHLLNKQGVRLQRDVTFLAHDVFRSWGKLRKIGPYDLVIVDPPSMQKGSFVAKTDYAKLVRRIEPLLATDADVLFCLNSPHLDEVFLRNVIENNSQKLVFAQRLEANEDFPEVDPSRNLKLYHYRAGSDLHSANEN